MSLFPLQKWDEKLKIIAEGYAVKCIWEHNPDLEELNMGENLFVSNGLFDPNIAMEKWFLEHLDYDYNNNSCQDDRMCGHYTQVRDPEREMLDNVTELVELDF